METNKLPTAKQYFDSLNKTKVHGEFVLTESVSIKAMIEFAKLHIQKALKEASEKAEINYEDFSGKYIDKDSILNAYNLDEIK